MAGRIGIVSATNAQGGSDGRFPGCDNNGNAIGEPTMNDKTTDPDFHAKTPSREREGFSLARLLLCAWALVATLVAAFSLTLLIREPDNVMGMTDEQTLHCHRLMLQDEFYDCCLDVRRQARQSLENGSADFGDVLDVLLAEKTEDAPNGSLMSFRIWLAANPTNWVHDYCSSTNLVLVSFNNSFFGEDYNWFSNGVLFATSDCDLTKLDLGNRNRWRSKTFPGIVSEWRGSTKLWKREVPDGSSPNQYDDFPLWDMPPYVSPYARKKGR